MENKRKGIYVSIKALYLICVVFVVTIMMYTYVNTKLITALNESNRLVIDIQSTCMQYEIEINNLYNALEDKK